MNPPAKLKVFLIEDAPPIRLALTTLLQENRQIEVVGFADSEQDALHALRSCEWDVAIVDIGLREGNGLGVLAGLQRDSRPYGPRLVFTNNPSAALQKRSLALGADGFFDKAADLDLLVAHIDQLLH